MSKKPRATVREIGGKVVLDDPDFLEVIRAVSKCNCEITLKLNMDRVVHFKKRFVELGLDFAEAVIILANANDVNGNVIAEGLMPGTNWQEIRDRGQIPFARGLVSREVIRLGLEIFDREAALKLAEFDGLAVVVVDHGVAEIFPA